MLYLSVFSVSYSSLVQCCSAQMDTIMEQTTGDTEAQASRANNQERNIRRMHSKKEQAVAI